MPTPGGPRSDADVCAAPQAGSLTYASVDRDQIMILMSEFERDQMLVAQFGKEGDCAPLSHQAENLQVELGP